MTIQYSTTHRTNNMQDIVTQAGTGSYVLLFTGSTPANCAAAATGTELVACPCSSTFGTVSSGVLTANAITSTAAVNTGTAGYWRLNTTSSSGGVCVAQGTVYQTTTLTTSSTTAADGNTLTFTATTGVVVGMTVSGTGVPANTTVVAVSSTTVTMSNTSTAGVGSGVTITFGGDISMNNTSIAATQTVDITSLTITANGA